MEVYGVLLDTVSIQKYIFGSNKLKENLGASFIVKNIYKDVLRNVLLEMFPDHIDLDRWEREPQRMPVIEESAPFEVGYIGGGNAFLIFRDESKMEQFIKSWSTRLLIEAPGLVTAVAIHKEELKSSQDEKFGRFINDLLSFLGKNKNEYIPQTVIPRHGITAECPRTGYSMEVWGEQLPDNDKGYISSVSSAKLEAAKSAEKEMESLLKELDLFSNYTFTDELERLGQQKHEESHIAIVHIDGNGMGDRFKEQKTLEDIRQLSSSLSKATCDSFKELVKKITEEFNKINDEFNISKDNGKCILPIRPIIIGGDDITFVTDGRLGLYFAKLFLEEFEKKKVSDGKPISACAGIAITKTKYPFYRGYHLSEELCNNAKKIRKSKNDSGSWLDFHLLKGSVSGELKRLRAKDYETLEANLYMRPYSLEDFKALLKGASEFLRTENGKLKFPRSKLMKLRDVLYKDEATRAAFLKQLEVRGLRLPAFKDFDGGRIIIDKLTPYLDMIEVLELYPEYALKEALR